MRIGGFENDRSLNHLTGGASDAVEGSSVNKLAKDAAGESQFESLDALVLRRLRAHEAAAAATTLTLDETGELAARTAAMLKDPSADPSKLYHEHSRQYLRDLLG